MRPQTQPAPEGWLPQEQSREHLPAKFFGTWCKVKEDEDSEEYQRPPRGQRCVGIEISNVRSARLRRCFFLLLLNPVG